MTSLPRQIAASAGRVAIVGAFEGWGVIERRGMAAIDALTGDLLPFAPDFEFRTILDMSARWDTRGCECRGSAKWEGGDVGKPGGRACQQRVGTRHHAGLPP